MELEYQGSSVFKELVKRINDTTRRWKEEADAEADAALKESIWHSNCVPINLAVTALWLAFWAFAWDQFVWWGAILAVIGSGIFLMSALCWIDSNYPDARPEIYRRSNGRIQELVSVGSSLRAKGDIVNISRDIAIRKKRRSSGQSDIFRILAVGIAHNGLDKPSLDAHQNEEEIRRLENHKQELMAALRKSYKWLEKNDMLSAMGVAALIEEDEACQ